jgi:hypothetical protein
VYRSGNGRNKESVKDFTVRDFLWSFVCKNPYTAKTFFSNVSVFCSLGRFFLEIHISRDTGGRISNDPQSAMGSADRPGRDSVFIASFPPHTLMLSKSTLSNVHATIRDRSNRRIASSNVSPTPKWSTVRICRRIIYSRQTTRGSTSKSSRWCRPRRPSAMRACRLGMDGRQAGIAREVLHVQC